MVKVTGWNINTKSVMTTQNGTTVQKKWDLKEIWDQTANKTPEEAKQFLIQNGLDPALAAALITLKDQKLVMAVGKQSVFSDSSKNKYSITEKQEDTIVHAANRVFTTTFVKHIFRTKGKLYHSIQPQEQGWNIDPKTWVINKNGQMLYKEWNLRELLKEASTKPFTEAKEFLTQNGVAPALAAALLIIKKEPLILEIIPNGLTFKDSQSTQYTITPEQEDTIIEAANRVFGAKETTFNASNMNNTAYHTISTTTKSKL